MSAAPHPTRVVRFNLMVVLLGVALPFAISVGVEDPSWPRITILVAFLLMALNFFHGKVSTLEDEDFNQALMARPRFALFNFAANIVIVLGFDLMAYSMDKPLQLLFTNVAVRGIDLILVVCVKGMTDDPEMRRAQSTWLWIDVAAIIVWLASLYPAMHHGILDITAITFLVISIGDVMVDYSRNSRLYFESGDSWESLATLWDDAQGESGDLYRREVIWPALENLGRPKGRVLDVGCGNGCLSRQYAQWGVPVTAVDGFETMLSKARSYDSDGIEYALFNLDSQRGHLPGGPFALIVACFTLQDIDNLPSAMSVLALNLAADGELVVIFEDEKQLSSGNVHSSTRRRWLDSDGASGRRQLIMWDPNLLVRCTSDGSALSQRVSSELFSTITHVWRADEYVHEAQRVGLGAVEPVRTLLPPAAAARSGALRSYSLHPRFCLLRLRHEMSSVLPSPQLASGGPAE